MKRRYLSTFLAITLFTTSNSVTPASAAGRTATSIPNTILNGKGAPTNTLGINGDFYIDTRSLLIFGPKANGKWPAPQNLQGPTGAAGPEGKNGSDGKNGADGKTISNASSTTGPAGPAGPQGERGLPGAAGAPGPAGPTGPQGATGPSGSGSGPAGPIGPTGPQGATGVAGPQGATGPAGPAGSTGATGAAGPQGTTGATGPQGATGAVGPAGLNGLVNAITGTFTIPDISGNAGTSQVGSLSGFKAGKNYFVRVKIVAYLPSDSSDYLLPLAVVSSATSGAPTIVSKYHLTRSPSYRTGAIRYENSVDMDLTLDGTAVATDYGVAFTVTVGRNTTGAQLVRFDASFVALEVQTISTTF